MTSRVAKKCGVDVLGPEVGSCAPLPHCLLMDAIDAARDLAAFPYGVGSCSDGFLARGEVCPGLEGPPGSSALEAVRDRLSGEGVPEDAIEEDGDGNLVARTQLEVWIGEAATIGAVNASLAAENAEIRASTRGTPVLVVSIPDPGALSDVQAVADRLAADPAIDAARLALMPEPDLVPPGYDFSDVELVPDLEDRLDHDLVVRGPAAWNLIGRMVPPGRRPTVVVIDYFGEGEPEDLELVFPDGFGEFDRVLAPDDHGYHVLGILAGEFGGLCEVDLDGGADRDCVTGMLPGRTTGHVVDLTGNISWPDADQDAIQMLRDAPGKAILSTSLAFRNPRDPAVAIFDGGGWAQKMRDAGLETRALHLTSAGNVRVAGQTDARPNSPYTASTLLGTVVTPGGASVPPLFNVLPVENVRTSFFESPPTADCLSASSKQGGLIAGIGTNVWSFLDAGDTAGNLSGTSMSTPQVAGLAAYLWALDPGISVSNLKSALVGNGAPVSGSTGARCANVASAPLIDAYASVLSLDGTRTPSAAETPMRHALLDVAPTSGDGRFDEIDLTTFLVSWFPGFVSSAAPGRSPAAAGARLPPGRPLGRGLRRRLHDRSLRPPPLRVTEIRRREARHHPGPDRRRGADLRRARRHRSRGAVLLRALAALRGEGRRPRRDPQPRLVQQDGAGGDASH